MIYKKIISSVLYFVFFAFIGLVFTSFTAPETVELPATISGWLIYFRENWAVIALLLSELAALLPGKPKGLIQTFVIIMSKCLETKTGTKKRRLL